jgi:hypothetical protein
LYRVPADSLLKDGNLLFRRKWHPFSPAPTDETLVCSRLLEYELWNRIHARDLTATHGELVRQLVGRVALLALSPPVLARALEPFPSPVRTLDALHLASLEFLRERGQAVSLASYDERMVACARLLGVQIYSL